MTAFSSPPPPSPQGTAGWAMESITWDGTATLIAGVLAAGIAILGYSIQQRLARRERIAGIYSEALRAVEDYLEAPYLLRRRDGSAATRTALTMHISSIQSRIAYYSALMQIHAPKKVSSAYDKLVRAARLEAGPQMTEAWKARPTKRDRDVPLPAPFSRAKSDVERQNFIGLIRRRWRRHI
jgi:hypothetical protein